MITVLKTIRGNKLTFTSEKVDTGFITTTSEKPERVFTANTDKLTETIWHLKLREAYITKEGGTLDIEKSTVINSVLKTNKNPVK